ncbi:MAG TPA: glycosyltransferase family 4 protein [Bacteroidota bacterium]|nr:glycosyltransferase family 4 protein [Bacteroidota bacterium]
MTSVHLYSPYWSTFGGGEKYVIAFASALSQLPDLQVTMLSAHPAITKEILGQYFNVDLGAVDYQLLTRGEKDIPTITGNSDLFVCLSNYRYIESGARTKVYLLQIPYARITLSSILAKTMGGTIREAAKDLYRIRFLSRVQNDTDRVVVNSHFVQKTLEKSYGIRSTVLHPPIQDFSIDGTVKKNTIVSVGRFFRGLYNDKRYVFLTEQFRTLCRSSLKGWEYHIIGSCSFDRDSSGLLNELRTVNQGFPVFFHVNESYDSMRMLVNEANVFWHAAGYGADEERHPERTEHFGMTTAEAMSAGCIPIVVNKGGQREIVRHGVDGFLWNTAQELEQWTLSVAQHTVDLPALRNNARERSLVFSIESFRRGVMEIFQSIQHEPRTITKSGTP